MLLVTSTLSLSLAALTYLTNVRLNGIFGNTDLILHYLGQFEAAQRKQAWMNLSIVTSPTSIQQSPASPTQIHSDSLSVQDGSLLDLESTAGANIYGSFLKEVRLCATTIQSCAEHQKRMTDDVLQLSRLRSHKLVVENVYFRPWDMVQTTLQAFRVQADKKVMHCSNLSLKFTHLFCFRDWNCDLSHKDWTSARRSLGTTSGRIRSYTTCSPMQSSSH